MASEFERVANAVHTALGDSTIAYGVLRVDEAKRDALRRIVWIPIDWLDVPAPRTNPMRDASGQLCTVLGQEQWNVEAHITAASLEDVEAIRLALKIVMREMFGTDSVPNGGVWVTQDVDRAGVSLARAEKAVQRFRWTINVIDRRNVANVSTIETLPLNESPFVMPEP